LVRPVTVALVALPATVSVLAGAFPETGETVTRYPVTGALPGFLGAVQVTATEALPALTWRRLGASGARPGTTPLDRAEAGPVPSADTALTVKL
jgi:hypothetical protein